MEPLRKLWNGIDTVKVNFGVAWPREFEKLLTLLDQQKQLAMDHMEPVVFSLCQDKPFDQVVALHTGSRNARYGIQVEGLTIFFSCRQLPHADTPNLYVEAGPEFVAERGLTALHAFVLDLIHRLGGECLWNKVSEVHLTFDHEVDAPHTEADYRDNDEFAFVTRARTKIPRYGYREETECEDDGYAGAALIYKGHRLETLQIGKGQMMLRINDKQAELARRPRKSWERLLWSDSNAQHVLRTEFQVRREVLRLMGFDTIQDIIKGSDTLWAYLTKKWSRLYMKTELLGHAGPVAVFHPFWLAVIPPKGKARRPLLAPGPLRSVRRA